MMTISTAISLLSALIGSVATLMAAWGYLRSHRPPRGELLRTGATVTVIMLGIFGIAILISNFTSIQINGQKNVTMPPVFAPHYAAASPTTAPTSSPKAKPTKTSTSVSASKSTQNSKSEQEAQPTQQTTSSVPTQTTSSSSSTSITPVATP